MRNSRVVLGLALALVAGGCEQVFEDRYRGEGAELLGSTCERDPLLIEANMACSEDSVCPCGSRCEFGRCIATCYSDADCGEGLVCRRDGQCGASHTIEPSAEDEDNNFVRVTPSVIRVPEPDAQARLTIGAGNVQDSTKVVVEAMVPEVRIQCPGSSTTSGLCELQLTRSEPTVELLVENASQGSPSTESGRLPSVRVSTRFRQVVVPVELSADNTGAESLQAGVYAGSALMSAIGRDDRSVTDPLDSLAVEVEVELFEESPGVFSVSIKDDLELFRPGPATGLPGRDALPLQLGRIVDGVFSPAAAGQYINGQYLGSGYTLGLGQGIREIEVLPQGRLRLKLVQEHNTNTTRLSLEWTVMVERLPFDRAPTRPGSPTVAPFVSVSGDPLNAVNDLLDAEFPGLRSGDGNSYDKLMEVACGPGNGESGYAFAPALGLVEEIGTGTQAQRAVRYDGELACTGPGLLENIDLPIFPFFSSSGVDPSETPALILNCLGEFDALMTSPSWDEVSQCISTARWAMSAALGLGAVEESGVGTEEAERVGSYMVTRMLDILGFLVETYRTEYSDYEALGRLAPPLFELPPPELVLPQMVSYWDAILHPAVLLKLMNLSPGVLVQPDYRLDQLDRSDLINSLQYDNIQRTPMSESILHSLVTQSDFWTDLSGERLRDSTSQTDDQVKLRRAIRDGFRRGLLLFAVASRLDDRLLIATELPELPPDDAEIADLAGQEELVFDEFIFGEQSSSLAANFAANMRRAGEYLSIQSVELNLDNSVPWAAVGDVTGTNARFRALSEVMVGNGQAIGGVVGTALGEAERSLGLAVEAYGRYRRTALVLQQLQRMSDGRLDYIAVEVGSEVVKNCGFDVDNPVTGYEIFEQVVDPSSCFIDVECLADGQQPLSEAVVRYRLCQAAYLDQALPEEFVAGLPFGPKYSDDSLISVTQDREAFVEYFVSIGDYEQSAELFGTDMFDFDGATYSLQDLVDYEIELREFGVATEFFADAENVCRTVFERVELEVGPASCVPESVSLCDGLSDDECDQALSNAERELSFGAESCEVNARSASVAANGIEARCTRGELGVEYRRVLAARADLERVQAEANRLADQYDVELAGCQIIEQRSAAIQATYAEYLDDVKRVRDAVVSTTEAHKALEAATDCVIKTGDALTGAAAEYEKRKVISARDKAFAADEVRFADEKSAAKPRPKTPGMTPEYRPKVDLIEDPPDLNCGSNPTCQRELAERRRIVAQTNAKRRAKWRVDWPDKKLVDWKMDTYNRFDKHQTVRQRVFLDKNPNIKPPDTARGDWVNRVDDVGDNKAVKAKGATRGAIGSSIFKGGACALKGAAAAMEAKIVAKEKEIDNETDELTAKIAGFKEDAAVNRCYNSLNKYVAKFGPAMAKIKVATSKLAVAGAKFEELKANTTLRYYQGLQWQANLMRRRLIAVPQDFQYRRFFSEFRRDIERLQDALVMANHAVKYELQRDVVDEAEIRRSRDIESLRRMAYDLKDAVTVGRVRAGTPTEGRVVLSVRDDLLSLEQTNTPGFRQDSPREQLLDVLTDSRFRVYDGEGNYTGQAIPFVLSPDAVGEDAVSLALATGGLLCGEKVWSVGAVVAGRDFVSADQQRSLPMFLRKRNSFSTRACTPTGELEEYFATPVSLNPDRADDSITNNGYSAVWLNSTVYRTNFDSSIRNRAELGELSVPLSNGLAGLGLYGDYELFIPASTLDEGSVDLTGLLDIFLVFDILGVANSTQF